MKEIMVTSKQFLRRIIREADLEKAMLDLATAGWDLSDPEELEDPGQLEFLRETFTDSALMVDRLNALSSEGWKRIEVQHRDEEDDELKPENWVVLAVRAKYLQFEVRGTRKIHQLVLVNDEVPKVDPELGGYGVPSFLPEDIQ